jgi:hypothetical protein
MTTELTNPRLNDDLRQTSNDFYDVSLRKHNEEMEDRAGRVLGYLEGLPREQQAFLEGEYKSLVTHLREVRDLNKFKR